MPQARNKSQLAIDETIVEDDELLQALIDRQRRKDAVDALRLELAEADERARTMIGAKLDELSNAEALRVGDWRITRETRPARTVPSFETKPSVRIRIEAIKEGSDD